MGDVFVWPEHPRAHGTTEGTIKTHTCPGTLLGRSHQVRQDHRIYPLIEKRKGAGIERQENNKRKARNKIWKNIVHATNYSFGFRYLKFT